MAGSQQSHSQCRERERTSSHNNAKMNPMDDKVHQRGEPGFIRALAHVGIPDVWAKHLPSLYLALFDPTRPSRERLWSACHEFAAFLVALPELLRTDTMSFLIGIAPVDPTLLSKEERRILTDWYSMQTDLYRWQLELVVETADDATCESVLARLTDLLVVRLDPLLLPRLRQARFVAKER
jgi:hypothetical protein